MKTYLINSAFIFGAFTLGACASSLNIKIYKNDVEKQGFYREQEKELVKWQEAEGFYCTDTAGMRKLAEAYKFWKEMHPNE